MPEQAKSHSSYIIPDEHSNIHPYFTAKISNYANLGPATPAELLFVFQLIHYSLEGGKEKWNFVMN